MKQHPELDRLERQEMLRPWRDWCAGLGLLGCGTTVITSFGTTVGNPKTWSSAYHALATAGGLNWLALPLLIVGGVFARRIDAYGCDGKTMNIVHSVVTAY